METEITMRWKVQVKGFPTGYQWNTMSNSSDFNKILREAERLRGTYDKVRVVEIFQRVTSL